MVRFGGTKWVMDELPMKLPYFVNTGGKPKFKRAVPADIRALVRKQNWVERVGTLSHAQLKAKSREFAYFTDQEIARHRAQLTSGAVEPDIRISSFLSDVDNLVTRYRTEREEARLREGSYFLPPDQDPRDAIEEAELDVNRAVENASTASTSPWKAAALLMRSGYVEGRAKHEDAVAKIVHALLDDQAFERLCNLLEIEDVRLAQSRLRALKDKDFSGAAQVTTKGGQTGGQSTGKQVSLKLLTDEFLRWKPTNLTRSRMSQLKLAIQLLHMQFDPDIPIMQIEREKCRAFALLLPRIPAYLHHHYKGMAIDEAVEEYARRHGSYAERHAEGQKILQTIRSIFQLAVDEQWLERNPWDGLAVRQRVTKKFMLTKSSYEAFPIEALNKLFALPLFAGRNGPEFGRRHFLTHRYWAPIVALYSGMRMNEILQLETADIQPSGAGIDILCVTDEEAQEYDPNDFQKRVKTQKSLRRIPIHPKLHEIGFVAWAKQQPPGRLFPEAAKGSGEKPSDLYSKRFKTDLKNAGIWKHRRQVFHSFRHTFNAALKAGGVPEDCREAINGWSHQRTMDSHYGAGKTDQRLFEEIKKVDYPGLDISALMGNAKFITGNHLRADKTLDAEGVF